MKKIKAKKSLYASGPKPNIVVEGATPRPRLSRDELQKEHDALMITIAAIVKENGGRVMVSKTAFEKVKTEKHTLQIVDGELGFSVQFDDFQEREESHGETVSDTGNFLGSESAREAREYLAGLRSNESRDNNGGIPETE